MNPSTSPEIPAGLAAEFLKGSGLPIPTLSVVSFIDFLHYLYCTY